MISAEQRTVLYRSGEEACKQYIEFNCNHYYLHPDCNPVIGHYADWEKTNPDYAAQDSLSRMQFFNAFHDGWINTIHKRIAVKGVYSRNIDELFKVNGYE